MQEIAERLERLEGSMQRIEKALEKTLQEAGKKEKNTLRRKQYREAKAAARAGLVSLPERHMIMFRDKRMQPKARGWAEVGMRFGRKDKPEQFFTWIVHQWNNCSYLRKPITFSGSSFRVWGSHIRYSYGPRDLMGFAERRGTLQLLSNAAEHDDFMKRPWWDWSYAVLFPVFQEMEGMGFADLPERFRKCVKLMLGGFSEYEVYTGLRWDVNETRENLNRMLRRVGTDLQLMLRACYTGLRVKGLASPVALPEEP